MTKTFNRRLAIKAAIAYSVVSGGAKAFAFNLSDQTVEEYATPSQRRTKMDEVKSQYPPLPADDLKRTLTLAHIDENDTLPHIGLVGDTYTITVTGAETAGRFCVIDMHIPPGGGPPLHRLEIIYAERSSASRATLSLDSHCGYSDLLFFRPPRFVSKQ